MKYWVFIGLAVLGNVVANLGLKLLAPATAQGVRLDAQTMTYGGAIVAGCVVLGGFYFLALRGLPLATAYAWVTSGALLAITAASPFVFGTDMTASKVFGAVLVVAGLFFLSRA